MRFEPPESKNRWDSTLYTVRAGEELPFEDIVNTLFNKQAPPPNKSTLNVSKKIQHYFFKAYFFYFIKETFV